MTADAGDFGSWLSGLHGALRGEQDSDVPCGTCIACCTASQFIHIDPDETDTLEYVPRELLFPAPGMPPGHLLMGYDRRGHCPMLVDSTCTVYAHRPRACRVYDCRVFAATGIVDDDPRRRQVAERAARWRFDVEGADAVVRSEAVQAAASFLDHHADVLPAGSASPNASQRAVLAINIHEVFLREVDDRLVVEEPSPQVVHAEALRVRPLASGELSSPVNG